MKRIVTMFFSGKSSYAQSWQDPWHPLTGNHPTLVTLAVCQGGQTPVEAYVEIKQAYPGSSFGGVAGWLVMCVFPASGYDWVTVSAWDTNL